MKVIKRDGRLVDFDKSKIVNAILKAFESVDNENLQKYGETISDSAKNYEIAKANTIADYIYEYAIKEKRDLNIEEIQDLVEAGLQNTKRKDVAKAYIIYRNDRTRVREGKSVLMSEIGKKLQALDVQNQNANIDERSFGGRIGEAANALSKQYALDYVMSDMARNNHLNNEIYTHDLDRYSIGMHNCLSCPIDDLLSNGFNVRQCDVRPANSINTACQLIAVIFQLQSLNQFGGVSATHVDHSLVPYFRKSFLKHYIIAYIKTKPEFLDFDLEKMLFGEYEDGVGIIRNKFDDWLDENKEYCLKELNLAKDDFKLDNVDKLDKALYQSALYDTIVETKQGIEGLYHNLNTLQSRSGDQVPFSSINYGTCTSKEGRIIIRAILEGSIKGVGKYHKTSIFPCGIFQCMNGVNRKPGDPNYDLFRLALVSTSKRLYPNYANVDWSGNAGYDINDPRTYFSTMGCRTTNGYDINHEPEVNPLIKDGRGNICPVTIILPTLAMKAKEEVDNLSSSNSTSREKLYVKAFMNILDIKIHEAKDQLIERFEYIASQPAASAKFMYENHTMLGYKPEEGIRSALKHGTIAIGQLGLAEALHILVGCDHTEKKGMELAKRIEQLFKDRCAEFKNEYKLNFGVYYSPCETLCYTALRKFREKYGIIPNVSDKEFFTNSMHVPVWKKVTPFEKIDIESQLTGYSSAGCITYVELDGGMEKNIDALETIVNYAMDHDIPYFAVNVPNDTCNDCGFTGEFDLTCPQCGSSNINHLRRVTGYLTGDYKTAFNLGKQDEVEHRFRHSSLMEV